MAIYHLTAKTITRARGQSAAAKFQYINRAGRYARQRDKCLVSGSSGMPKWAAGDPLRYWRAADRHERKNACLAREIECALPVELDLKQQAELVREFIERNLPGQPCSWAIHAGKGRNPHVHIMFSDRTNDGIERDAETWFRRHNPRKPEAGGARKNRAFKPKSWLLSVRESWAEVTNRHLKAAGFHIEIDHRSHAERGIPEPPGMHYGPTFHARPGPDHPRRRRFKERQQRKKRRRKSIRNGMSAAGQSSSSREKGRSKERIRIPGLKPTALDGETIVWVWRASNKAALIDRGDEIELPKGSLAAWRRCVRLAKAKGWKGINLQVTDWRMAAMAIRAALEQGLPVASLKVNGRAISRSKIDRAIRQCAGRYGLSMPGGKHGGASATGPGGATSSGSWQSIKTEIKRALNAAGMLNPEPLIRLAGKGERHRDAIAEMLAERLAAYPEMYSFAASKLLEALQCGPDDPLPGRLQAAALRGMKGYQDAIRDIIAEDVEASAEAVARELGERLGFSLLKHMPHPSVLKEIESVRREMLAEAEAHAARRARP